jgi:hypothetical protein
MSAAKCNRRNQVAFVHAFVLDAMMPAPAMREYPLRGWKNFSLALHKRRLVFLVKPDTKY